MGQIKKVEKCKNGQLGKKLLVRKENATNTEIVIALETLCLLVSKTAMVSLHVKSA